MTLEARREGNTLVLSVQDDGRGLDYEAIAAKGRRLGLLGPDEAPTSERLNALIFLARASRRASKPTRSPGGGRHGRRRAGGRPAPRHHRADSKTGRGHPPHPPAAGPARLEQAMIARVDGQAFAIPVALIEHAQSFEPGDVERTGSEATVRFRDRRVPLIVARECSGFLSDGAGFVS